MLFLSVRGFSDCAGPASHSRLAWLPCCLPPLGMEAASVSTGLSQLNSSAHRCLCLRFKKHLTMSPARLEVRMDSLLPFLVGVGIVIAHDPLHGSGRADFPHPALTSGNDAHAAQWIRMIYACGRQPPVAQSSHSVPAEVAVLAPARERLVPEQAYPKSKRAQRGAVDRHSVITDVSTNDRPQPLAYFRDGVVHASSEFVFCLAQLRLHPLTNRLPQHRVVTVASRLPADMREAKEGERFRLPFSALFPCSGREPPELQKSRFVGMQFQAELP